MSSQYHYLSDVASRYGYTTLNKGFDNVLTFPNCADTEDGFLHDLEGAEVTYEVTDKDGNVVDTITQTVTENKSLLTYNFGKDINESLDEGVYKLKISYYKDGYTQLFSCCRYILREC